MNEYDDFPMSPGCVADAQLLFEAYLKAEEYMSVVPANSREESLDRAIFELTAHMYESRGVPQPLFRANLGVTEALAAVWLSRVRVIAEWVWATNDVPIFEGLSSKKLTELAGLTTDFDRIRDVPRTLLANGVILIHERYLPGMKADGAVFMLPSGNPVVGLSLRYPRLDNYWFTLMHELAHIVLHRDALATPIVDDLDAERSTLIERQADRLASDSLIPRNVWRSCDAKYSLAEADVFEFAARVGVAPQIVAGRIQRELRRYNIFTKIVNAIDVRRSLLGND